jgi:N-carbamoyl-L-amino-acid hydrolase
VTERGVELPVDVCDLDDAKVARLGERFRQVGAELGRATGMTFGCKEPTVSKAAIADPRILNIIAASAHSLGITHLRMPSGAGRDAQEVAHICPMGTTVIPSIGGVSHSPEAFSKAEDVVPGVNVLLSAVKRADAL